jgi:tetratricopeptide (TPR) repeat protein
MRKHRLALALLITGCTALFVLFLQLPKQPASALDKVQNQDPDSLRLQQAIALVNGAAPMEGIRILQSLVASNPDNVDAQYTLGLFSVKSGQFDKAVERFDKVASIKKDDAAYQFGIGYEYLKMDSLARALRCFERAIELDSTHNNALFFAAQVLEHTNRLAEAKRDYEQLLRHNTDSVVALRVNEYIDTLNIKLNP